VYCQTETARRRFHEKHGYPLERIGVCPNAFSPLIKASEIWPEPLAAFRGRFVVFVLAKYYNQKNLERVAALFHRYREAFQEAVCVLTISAEQGWRARRLIRRIQRWGLGRQVLCVGSIAHEELGRYFHAADVLFLPTLLESFTSTFLEAMQFDVPIVTSDLDFAREVCGNAAEYVTPFSLKDMADGILRIMRDSALREQLVAAGRERLEEYHRTWPDILRDVLDQEGIEHA